MKAEKIIRPTSGYIALVLLLAAAISVCYGFTLSGVIAGLSLLLISLLLLKILIIVGPNSSKVLLLFGEYKGSIKESGLFWVNPFYSRAKLSLRARNFESEKIKVNDKMGNPIMISVILVWKVKDTFKAKFEVDSFGNSTCLLLFNLLDIIHKIRIIVGNNQQIIKQREYY